jgi:hypothetical protein
MAYKPRGTNKNPSDLMALLVNSKIQTQNNALYQTIYGLITILEKQITDTTEAKTELEKKIEAIDTTSENEIPDFFFMGSS